MIIQHAKRHAQQKINKQELTFNRIDAIPSDYEGFVNWFKLPVYVTVTEFFIYLNNEWRLIGNQKYASAILA